MSFNEEGVGNQKEQTEFWPIVKSVMQNVCACTPSPHKHPQPNTRQAPPRYYYVRG